MTSNSLLLLQKWIESIHKDQTLSMAELPSSLADVFDSEKRQALDEPHYESIRKSLLEIFDHESAKKLIDETGKSARALIHALLLELACERPLNNDCIFTLDTLFVREDDSLLAQTSEDGSDLGQTSDEPIIVYLANGRAYNLKLLVDYFNYYDYFRDPFSSKELSVEDREHIKTLAKKHQIEIKAQDKKMPIIDSQILRLSFTRGNEAHQQLLYLVFLSEIQTNDQIAQIALRLTGQLFPSLARDLAVELTDESQASDNNNDGQEVREEPETDNDSNSAELELEEGQETIEPAISEDSDEEYDISVLVDDGNGAPCEFDEEADADSEVNEEILEQEQQTSEQSLASRSSAEGHAFNVVERDEVTAELENAPSRARPRLTFLFFQPRELEEAAINAASQNDNDSFEDIPAWLFAEEADSDSLQQSLSL
jgi:hypothetical protein